MKILFFIESLRSGGKERRLVELIKGLSKNSNFNLELVLTRDKIHYQDIFSTGVKIHYTIRKRLKKDPMVFYKFYKIAKKFNPDIIHVWGNMVAVYAIPTKLLLKIPLVNSQITDAPKNVSNSILSHKLTFPFSDKIISNTKAGLKAYDAPISKSCVIYNGFDFDRIKNLDDKIEIKNKFKIKTKYIIGMVASFSENKDYTTFIKASELVLEKNNNVTFLCVGSGNDSVLKKMIKNTNKNAVLFLGKQNKVESIMNICDIGVLTSNALIHGEGISNSLMEFMALGKPVIANDCGGTRELIDSNVNGYLIRNYDFEELSNKILFLLNKNEIKRSLGNRSKSIVKEKFNISQMISEFSRIYEEVISFRLGVL